MALGGVVEMVELWASVHPEVLEQSWRIEVRTVRLRMVNGLQKSLRD